MAQKIQKALPAKAAVLPGKLSPRQARILSGIIREYSHSSQPVGSEEISEKYRPKISSATIRNEMMTLERLGYIEQPHTSSGRVPTDFGYRYFINGLMKKFELSLREQKFLHSQLLILQKQHQELGRSIAKLLAEKTDQAAFALLPDEISSAGLSNILLQPNVDKKGAAEIAEFFDNIDQYAGQLLTRLLSHKPAALIGKEGKQQNLPQISNYSLIISRVSLPSGRAGLIGVLGPKSMRYDKNISLVEYVAEFLSGGVGGAVVILLLMIR